MEKYIHYCWFGENKKSRLTQKCIKSWKRYLPNYKIIEWNEKNFDVNITKFSKEAYKEKKWAFVSDVARVYALDKMGGIYFDTDMMITKKIDPDILNSNFFVGWESDINIAVGVMGASKNNGIIQHLMKEYENIEFDKNNLVQITIPKILTKLLTNKYGMKKDSFHNQTIGNNIKIFSRDYFYPISSDKNIENAFTDKTCMVHYYSGSWLSREEKIQAKFNQMFGYKYGSKVLTVFIKIKRILKDISILIKDVLKLGCFPLIEYRRKNKKRKDIALKINDLKLAMKEFDNSSKQIVFCRREWMGVSNATMELFREKTVAIGEITYQEEIEYIVNKILDKNIKLVVFSGLAIGWDKIIEELKKENPDIIIKVIWHGGMALNVYDYDYLMFTRIIKQLENEKINSIAFVKKSMYEFFERKGFNVEFLYNRVNLDKKLISTLDVSKLNNGRTKIGIYASGDRWIKNFYNQIAAASLVENCEVDCVPISNKAYEIADILELDIKGTTVNLDHEDMLKRMSTNDINIYVTYTECAPIIPLESLELGVPCITGNNHHYFKGSELEDYLVVNEADDVNAIYQKILIALDNKEKIIKEYSIWKEENNKRSEDSIKKFLKIK